MESVFHSRMSTVGACSTFLLTAFCLDVRAAGLRSCSPLSVSLETSSSDSSQDEEKPAEEAEEEDSFLRERLEELGLELRLGVEVEVEDRPWSEPGSSGPGWLSGPRSVMMTAGIGREGGAWAVEGGWVEVAGLASFRSD